jgi:small subunit ribosomal protein S17e
MGRIKTKLTKRVGFKLFKNHGSNFTHDYTKNKEEVVALVSLNSKKLRNVIAGYITRLKRSEK